jgi:predicted choloylglycine hydrolase
MLSFLKISGSHHAVGKALGQFGAPALHHYAKTSPAWHHIMRFRDHPAVKQMQQQVQARHPQYWAELQGLADGLQMPLADVFAWNCRGDLWAWGPDGCTTVWQPSEPMLLAHNEDGDPLFAGQCAMAHIDVDQGPAFTGFVYPGSVPGHTFAANASGLCMTVNNLRTLHAKAGLPRMIITRHLIAQHDLQAALQYVQAVQPAGGFHVTLGQRGQHQMASVEFTSFLCSVMMINNAGGHANHMVHDATRHQPQIITGSSGFRQIRLAQCWQEPEHREPLEILFDQHNTAFPIFRDDPADPDTENTLASARFEITADAVQWQVHQGRHHEPVYRFKDDQPIDLAQNTTALCKMATDPQ